MAFQNGERAIDLFEQNDASEFVSKRHVAERDDVLGGGARRCRESVGWAYGEDEGRGISIPIIAKELREFFRRKLLATRVHQDQSRFRAAHRFGYLARRSTPA